MSYKILVIEDNADTRRFLQVLLSRDYTVYIAQNGYEGIALAQSEQPDLILLDVVMPHFNGYDTCKELKSNPQTKSIPIFFLSAKNTREEIAQGLALGAEDYLPKPFDHHELQARIKAQLMRQKLVVSRATEIKIAGLVLDPITRTASYQDTDLNLTLTEFDLLRLLASRPNQAVTREEIMKEVWREIESQTSDRTIDVHIRALRKKAPVLNEKIQSVYGVGYKFCP